MNSSYPPLISVVMPVYNSAAFVSDAIESILKQTYGNLELVVVLDGDTGESATIVADFAARENRIRPFFISHRGAAAAVNFGVAETRGEYIAFLDSDDIALPERLAVQIEHMRMIDVDLCGACVKEFGASSRPLWFPETLESIRAEQLFRVAILPSTVLARASVLKANPYVAGLIPFDYELWARLAPGYRLQNVQQILTLYRKHAAQDSVVHAHQSTEQTRMYRHRYFLTLFPEASEADWTALSNLAERKPAETRENLERAGQWLARLAQSPDAFLRARMAGRWHSACLRSAHLGPDCLRLYRRYAKEFDTASLDERRLQLQCSLRLRSGLPFVRWLRSHGYTRQNHHAAP